MFEKKSEKDFDAIKVSIASPEDIRNWSHGEVTKAETINYRTLRPEVDGLMCEKIFGPVKNYECHCGKYKGIRYKGIVCDKCGVEITHRRVRRYRMGHIELAIPVAHVWFSYGVPNKLAIIFDIPQKDLNSVIYYSKFMVIDVDKGKKKEAIKQLEENIDSIKKKIKNEKKKELGKIEAEKSKEIAKLGRKRDPKTKFKREQIDIRYAKKIAEIRNLYFKMEKEEVDIIKNLKKIAEKIETSFVISEDDNDLLVEKAKDFYEVEMGASALFKVLAKIDLDAVANELRELMKDRSKHKRMKARKRLHLIDGFRNNSTRPEWLILSILPVIPPELRPIIQLPGGRFATSDLNDLYRRVINRNNRLKRLIEIGAPDIILRNEKRMLQEAVDALIDNEHRPSNPVLNQRKQPYKSLSASLRGKKGRFRQNLLGKRVDYSGRSVIVGDASLTLNECGIPREMALEIFKPFVIKEIISRDLSPNIRSAKGIIEMRAPEVWDILEKLVKTHPVLLNRAPTLHKHGIQAFYPILVEGDAIRVNPLICEAFNADFDGDQMAVHLPLTQEAVEEAKEQMLARYNVLKMSDGKAIVGPKKDMIQGIYYLTTIDESQKKPKVFFPSVEVAISAMEMGHVEINDLVLIPYKKEVHKTSVGRVMFNQALTEKMPFINEQVNNKRIQEIIDEMLEKSDPKEIVGALDEIKRLGFKYATYSGISLSVDDCLEHPEKDKILEEAREREKDLDDNYMAGLLTEEEKSNLAIQLWLDVTEDLIEKTWGVYKKGDSIHDIIDSGNNGSLDQLKQIAAIKGLLIDPTGKYVEMPIVSNFKNGLSAFEYFTNARGARKGLADTALRTARSGYLTRKLVIVAGDLIIREEDCGQQEEGYFIRQDLERRMNFEETISGRYLVKDVVHPKSGEVIAEKQAFITSDIAREIGKIEEIEGVEVRSPLTCKSIFGICAKCYGADMGTRKPIKIGQAVGVVAAQAMGEQSTQLTLRTFHFGGAQKSDITQGVPRIEELFEARTPKGMAYIADFDGKIKITESESGKRVIMLKGRRRDEQIFALGKGDHPTMKRTKTVKMGDVLYIKEDGTEVLSPFAGKALLAKAGIKLRMDEDTVEIYKLSEYDDLLVEDGQEVEAGQQLTRGAIDPKLLMKIKGVRAAQEYVIDEVQKIYAGQGVTIDEKHVEIIVRQMGNYVQIIDAGDTEYTPGQFASRQQVEFKNKILKEKGRKPASYFGHLMGITNASLRTDSFMSAISFQEQVRVLTEASILGKADYLRSLLENVIIGRLIPVGERADLGDLIELGEFKHVRDLKEIETSKPNKSKKK